MRTFFNIDSRIQCEKVEDLIKLPKIIRLNEFDEKALKDFEDDMNEAHSTGQDVIPIVIDSFGGSAYGAQGVIAAIESARKPVATILTSKAMSAGAIAFCFGTQGYRYMHPHACLMIHEVGSMTYGKSTEMTVDVNHVNSLTKSVWQQVSRQLGHNSDYILNLIEEHKHMDWFLTAKEAKKHNIANHLNVPSFEIDISLNVKFG